MNALEDLEEQAETELITAWAELARTDYVHYYEFMNREDGYICSPHQLLIANLLMSSVSKETMRFMLSMPPGHCKSTHSSHHFPAWYFGQEPKHRFLQAGHSQDFVAKELGAKVRQIINSEDNQIVFPAIRIRHDMRAMDYWALTNGKGKYVGKGVGQGISGFRGNYGMVDDPYKSRKAAESQTIRDDTFKWFSDDFSTRLLPGSPLGIIMCMVGETKVSMGDGTQKRLDQIEAEDTVLTWSNGQYAERRVLKASCQGEDDVFTIRTGSGCLTANTRHPFLVQRQNGVEWIRLSDIRTGDKIISAGRWEGEQRTDFTTDEAWALGFMFGDGWVTKNIKRNKDPRRPGQRCSPTASWVTCVADCPAYPDRHQRCIEILSAKFGAKFVYKTKERYWRTEKAALGKWLYPFGLGAGAKYKRLPPAIFSQSVEIRDSFLQGFMAADGCIERHGNYGVQNTLLSNRELIEDLRHLTRSLGYQVTNICDSSTTGRPPNSKSVKTWTNHGYKYHFEKEPLGPFTTSTVRSIKPAGRALVYDITVEEDECFLADGHVSHNTRWHSDDVCGRICERENNEKRDRELELLEEQEKFKKTITEEQDKIAKHFKEVDGGKKTHSFEIINLPAIAEENDVLGRAPGEPLWEELYDLEALANLKVDMTAPSWNSLYQGTPMDAEGGAIKRDWFQRYDQLPKKAAENQKCEIKRTSVSVDAANTAKERSDYTVIGVWIEDVLGNHYLVDVIRKQIEFTELCTEIDKTCRRWARITGSVDALLVEAKGNGLSYLQLKKDGGAPAPLISIEVGTSTKEFRFDKVTPMIEAGRIYLPNRALWLAEYERELVAFPSGKNDDQVDMTSQYLDWIKKKIRRGTKKASGTGYNT